MSLADCIVVGSGATGSMAAQTLIDRGMSVLMLDGGQRDESYEHAIPPGSFVDLRRSDPEQYRYFLGNEFQSVRAHESEGYVHLTPPRRFIIAQVHRFLRFASQTFHPVESLAYGGLGSGWGLGCGVFSERELQLASLPADEMREAYQVVADRIGISGTQDDAARYTWGGIEGVQPSIPADLTAATLLSSYQHKRTRLQAEGFRLGRPALALLTRPKDGRDATSLRDMDFYSDAERAAWRPWIAIERLIQNARFTYAGNTLVTTFAERDGHIEVDAIDMVSLEQRTYRCKRLVLAAGVFGTARIMLRSHNDSRTRLPLLCNPYTYMPCIVPRRIGKPMPDRNTGLSQLVLFHDQDDQHADVAQASIYTYRSLMMFRLLREVPIDMRDARELLQYALSGLVIAGIHHPQAYSAGSHLGRELDESSPTRDRLDITAELAPNESARIELRERGFMRALRSLGAYPIKRVRPKQGASIHYAGTLPFSDAGAPYTLARSGAVSGSQNVYVADGSGFTFLPAKGLTLSLMANAHRVAEHVARTAQS